MFIEDHCHEVLGESVTFAEFRDRFIRWLTEEDLDTKFSNVTALKTSLPQRFPYGKRTGNVRHIGNIAWERRDVKPSTRPLIGHRGRLIPKGT
jgi:hypothetical protein